MTRTWVLLVASATALLAPRPADASLFRQDSDGDGIRNRHDECPFEAEDIDLSEDEVKSIEVVLTAAGVTP